MALSTVLGRPNQEGSCLPPGVLQLLSRREIEVARLVGEGLTNPEIAEALCITPATVSRHVKHILTKLNVHRRAQVAAIAVSHGLVELPYASRPLPAAAAVSPSEVLRGETVQTVSSRPASPFDSPAGAVSRPRLLLPAGLLLGVMGVLVVALAIRTHAANATQALAAGPGHGSLLFSFQPSQGEAQFIPHTQVEGNDVRFTAAGLEFHADRAFEFAVARNVLAQDFVVQSHARQLSGDAGYQVQLRGCVDDSDQFYRVTVEPTSGAVSMQRAQCNTGTTLQVLLPVGRYLDPLPQGADSAITVMLRGQRLEVYQAGRLAAGVTDPGSPLPAGSVRFGALSPDVVLLTRFDVYRPA